MRAGARRIQRAFRVRSVWGAATLCVLALAGIGDVARAATQGSPAKTPVPSSDTPYRGNRDGISYGAYGELRFGHDRQAGVSNPDWFSVGQAGGFVRVRVHHRVEIAGVGVAVLLKDYLDRIGQCCEMTRSMSLYS